MRYFEMKIEMANKVDPDSREGQTLCDMFEEKRIDFCEAHDCFSAFVPALHGSTCQIVLGGVGTEAAFRMAAERLSIPTGIWNGSC